MYKTGLSLYRMMNALAPVKSCVIALKPIITDNVAKGSTVSTDELATYNALRESGYKHGTVQHGLKIYVNGIYHVNGIEGFWSHLKRGIVSTHASVSPRHLQKYVNEFAFRYDHRHAPAEMFEKMLAQIAVDQSFYS